MFFQTKKQDVPVPSEKSMAIDVARFWRVKWVGRNGPYSSSTHEEVVICFSKEDADLLANSLREAFKLIRHTFGNVVTVEEDKTT